MFRDIIYFKWKLEEMPKINLAQCFKLMGLMPFDCSSSRLMYWFNTVGSDGWPVIESSWMSGQMRQEIVTRGVLSVEDFSIDYAHHDVVYFVDTIFGIYSMNYDGSFVTQLGTMRGKLSVIMLFPM